MATKDPAFLFYTSDFLTGTMFMNDTEVGVYIRLLCAQHQHGGRIAKEDFEEKVLGYKNDKNDKNDDILGYQNDKNDNKIRKKFLCDNDGYYNKRLEIEINKRKKDADASRKNGLKGGRPLSLNEITTNEPKDNLRVINNEPNTNLSENENENENCIPVLPYSMNGVLPEIFEKFWNLYDKKVDKEKSLKKFKKLKKDEIDLIFKNLPNYVLSKPDKQYRKDPLTWLNGKCWNDEIISKQKEIKKFSVTFLTPTGRTTAIKTNIELEQLKQNKNFTVENIKELN